MCDCRRHLTIKEEEVGFLNEYRVARVNVLMFVCLAVESAVGFIYYPLF